jgi:hypothetical protein
LDPVEVNVAHISLPHTEEGNKERRKKKQSKNVETGKKRKTIWKEERKKTT